MKFRRGDLVTTIDYQIGNLELTSLPQGSVMSYSEYEKIKTTGSLSHKNIGIVTMIEGYDCRSVYVVGNSGSGWTLGAWIKKIELSSRFCSQPKL